MGATSSKETEPNFTQLPHKLQSTEEDVDLPVDLHSEPDSKEVAEIQDWADKSKCEIRMMVTGKSGVGKSALLNGIIGKKVFDEGDDLVSQTLKIELHTEIKEGVKVTVFDTPGLQDGLGNDLQYANDIRKICTEIDLLLYCIKMTDTRDDLHKHDSALKVITNALGVEIWKNAVIILTFANLQERRFLMKARKEKNEATKMFKENKKLWRRTIIQSLQQCKVPKSTCDLIRLIPASVGNEAHLETQPYWLSNFWMKSLHAMNKKAQLAMVKMSMPRLRQEKDVSQSDFDCDIADQPLVVTKLDKGVATGASGVGLLAGATTGALIGTFAIGAVTFGVAAGAGLVIGAVIGGAIGSSGGAGIGLIMALHRRNKKRKKLAEKMEEAFALVGADLAQK